MKPLLLLDVDGVLNPYPRIRIQDPDVLGGGKFTSADEFDLMPPHPGAAEVVYDDFEVSLLNPGSPMPVALSKKMGEDLFALQDMFEIGYATTWEHDVEQVAEVIGLPYTRSAGTVVIEWPQRPFSKPSGLWLDSTRIQQVGGSWKTPFVVDHMRRYHPDRPWLWADDDIRKVDAAYVRNANRGARDGWYNLYRVTPERGLTRGDMEQFRTWAERLA